MVGREMGQVEALADMGSDCRQKEKPMQSQLIEHVTCDAAQETLSVTGAQVMHPAHF
jgi:hypothetical protein